MSAKFCTPLRQIANEVPLGVALIFAVGARRQKLLAPPPPKDHRNDHHHKCRAAGAGASI
jgi:hypothetical protein